MLREHWDLIERDLQDVAVDVGDLQGRSWRWLRERILGLIDRPFSFDSFGQPVYANRLQQALYAPLVARGQATR